MNTKDTKQNNRFGSNIEIRLAHLNDVEDIIILNRNSFPDSLKERAPSYYLKKWWGFLVDSPSVEVYVITSNKIIAGFAVLVINEDNYKKDSKLYKLPKQIILYTLLTSPQCLFYLSQKIIARIRAKSVYKLQTENNSYLEKRTWIELAALSNEYQGKGLAKQLFLFLEKRTRELNCNTICSLLNKNNHAVIFLHKSLGYSKTGESAEHFYYKKSLL